MNFLQEVRQSNGISVHIQALFVIYEPMEFNLIDKQEEFLKLLQTQGKSFNTIKNYKADLRCFSLYLADKKPNLKMKAFTSVEVGEYSDYLDNKYSSPNSVRRRVQALRLFFDFLQSQNYFSENPLKKMPLSPKVLDSPNPTPFSEVIKTYEFLKKRAQDAHDLMGVVHARNLVIFHLIYGAGLKVSDLANLGRGSILKDKTNFRVLVDHPKRDPYSVPLPEIFNLDYTQYIKRLDAYQDKFQLDMDELLFNANPYKILSGGLSPRGIELFFEELRKSLQTKMTAKSLRQSCIFKWINMSVPETTIKEWLGVTPGYSLELYLDEIKKDPAAVVFTDLIGEV